MTKVAPVQRYLYSNTAAAAVANGPKQIRSTSPIPFMTLPLPQMWVEAIIFCLLPPKTSPSTALNLQRNYHHDTNCYKQQPTAAYGSPSMNAYANLTSFLPSSEATTSQRLDIQLMSKFSDHNCTVWRVSWNITGTILSSSGDDGHVRMWKSTKETF